MFIRRLSAALLPALLIIGCAAPAPSAELSPTDQRPMTNDQPASVVSRQAMSVPTATNVPAPTRLAAPTSAPARATASPVPSAPTSLPEPTLAPRPTAAPRPTVAAPPTSAPAAASPAAASPAPAEILFLRKGSLMAFDMATRKERKLVERVREFVAASDGGRIALVRAEEGRVDVWTVRRDGGDLRQITHSPRAEAVLSWSPDGRALVFGVSSSKQPDAREWSAWSVWCAASEVHVVTLADSSETKLGAGCDPAFSPDGKRIAYAAPPAKRDQSAGAMSVNSIRLVNRAGQNGWDFAKTTGDMSGANAGQVVYAPAFSPDGKQLAYHRFVGMQVEVDIALSEIGGSFAGHGKPMHSGAGWLLPARFSPDGKLVAITGYNYSDARGFGGYDSWSVTLLRLSGSREIAMPDGPLTAFGQQMDGLARAQQVAWSPDGTALAVELPPGWRADLPANEALGVDASAPGEIWLWKPGAAPQQKLIANVDPASPLVWLPAVR